MANDEVKCFYLEHRAAVARFIRRAGVTDTDLDDAVQDIFVIVHRKWDEFEARSTRRTWVLGIASFYARAYHRRRKRIAHEIEAPARGIDLAETEDGLRNTETAIDPLWLATWRQELALVASLIEELPNRWKTVLVHACVNGNGIDAAAAATGMTRRAAERAVEKARRRLRRRLSARQP